MASIAEGMTLFDALSQLVKEGKSGRLHVQHWDGKEGIIGLNAGRLVHCQYQRLRGAEAFRVVRNWMSISMQFFEKVENLSVDMEGDTPEILSSLETQDREIKNIRDLIPTPQAIFALSPDSPEGRVSLNGRIWKVLALINGRNSVKDICVTLRAGEFSVAKVLTHLHGRRIIQLVTIVRPIASQHREAFFDGLESALAQHIGPIAPVIIADTLVEMGKSREYINRNDLPLLVERIGETVEDDEERVQFQGHMLALIQRLFREGE
jgi:hypothetical protein